MQTTTPTKNLGFQGHSHSAAAKEKSRLASLAYWASHRKSEPECFWALVDKRGPDECWLWKGAVKNHGVESGYGKWRQSSAHKRAYVLTNGPVPEGLEVCHTCDVRGCCNPKHMYVGTHKQNMEDAAKRKRWSLHGKHHAASHDYATVRKIREDYATGNFTQRELMAKYSVCSGGNMSDIINMKIYRNA